MRVGIVLFTRDLRVHDNPALAAACEECERVVPLFVLDEAVLVRFGAPNRVAFLLESLRDLDRSLRARGGALVVRRGDVVGEVAAVGADAVYLAEDVSSYARRREGALRTARLDVRVSPGVTVIPPGQLRPSGGGDHFSVFTPYWRRWREAPRRALLHPPGAVRLPEGIEPGFIPEPDVAELSRQVPRGGEAEGRARLEAWLASGLGAYGSGRDVLAEDATSRLSPYLRFGCISPLEAVERAVGLPGGEEFVRQLCWRDFHYQLFAARPELSWEDMRPRGDRWRDDELALEAWKEGLTGYPLVDAGMRQLRAEGFMHNRARLATASFLTKHLYVDWRVGGAHFADLLVDGDIPNNLGNWQWVAGTGADTRPNRMFNPTRQAQRYDPRGDYVRRWVPELAGIEGAAVHEPWRLGLLAAPEYPTPIVDHDEAVARFRTARALS
ncbi:MAG TPA: deoxyribodipyrimidine photo-lyase [Gaiellaceae bacterium]|nr:deoxyribodipyrimidine photo-lyase [Gaiellaceae bacterium]